MKKHILSYYAKKDADYQCSISSKNTKETRTIEQTIISLRFRHGGEKITNLC